MSFLRVIMPLAVNQDIISNNLLLSAFLISFLCQTYNDYSEGSREISDWDFWLPGGRPVTLQNFHGYQLDGAIHPLIMPRWTAMISMGLVASHGSSPHMRWRDIFRDNFLKPVQANLFGVFQIHIFLIRWTIMVFIPKISNLNLGKRRSYGIIIVRKSIEWSF